MNAAKLAAVALTIIIACPIIIGYGLASENVETTYDQTTNGGSLSDIILNSETPYYAAYAGPSNNGTLMRTSYSQGVYSTGAVNPDYVETSSETYSSTAIYAAATGSVTMSNTVTIAQQTLGTTVGTPTDTFTPDLDVSSYAVAYLKGSLGGYPYYTLNIHTEDDGWSTVRPIRETYFTAIKTTDGYLLTVASDYTSGTTVSDVEYDVDAYYVGSSMIYVEGAAATYYDVSSLPDVWSASANGTLSLEVTTSSETYNIGFRDATSIYRSYTSVTVQHGSEIDTLSDVTGLKLSFATGDTTWSYSYTSSTIESYANVAYGWTIPASSNPYYDYWQNGYENSYLRLMLHLEPGEEFTIMKTRTSAGYILDLVSNSSTGYVTVNAGPAYDYTTLLGAYTDIMVELEAHTYEGYGTVTVTGIASWPAMGQMPDIEYNTVSYRWVTALADDFTELYISDVGTNSVEVRVDSAQIISGYFPSTKNYVLNLMRLFPDNGRAAIVIDSVGIYGTAIRLGCSDDGTGGEVFYVSSDGTVTVDGTAYTVRGLSIGLEYADDDATFTIGDHTYSGNDWGIGFMGEWSMIIHREVTESVTVTKAEWVPGEYALDTSGFVLVMLMAAAGSFVVLGMTGARSGAKIGLLALVCGGAAAIGLTIL